MSVVDSDVIMSYKERKGAEKKKNKWIQNSNKQSYKIRLQKKKKGEERREEIKKVYIMCKYAF